MAKYLVIVESPNKIHTVKSCLGKDYEVDATVGHIADLPPKKIGIDVKKQFAPTYEVLPGKKSIVDKLVKKAKKAQVVFLATDLDREGTAIAWHLSRYLPKGTNIKRIVYNEVTKKAILKAIEEAGDIDIDMVAAYETRRILDRLVGFKCSFPVKQATGGPSAGRVQSATLRFLAEREKEIKAFIPITYWDITAELITEKFEKIVAKLIKPDKLKVNSKKKAEEICETLRKGPIEVSKYERTESEVKPYAPFVTSTLQQAASTFLGWNPKRAMKTAQQLFEGTYITYHRTDSTHLSADFVSAMRSEIQSEYGEKYLPSSQWHYGKKKNAQEAHEAIRPTDITRKCAPSGDQNKLYQMIRKRTMASQMSKAKFLRSKAEFSCKSYVLSVSGSKCLFDGWRKCWNYGSLDDSEVPELKKGQKVNLVDVTMKEEQTKPPSRFTEASTIKQMEKLGIGRPATYAATIDTLKNRKYIETKKKSIEVTDLGVRVMEFLVAAGFCFVDLCFTAHMEEELDKVASSDRDKLCVLTEFYDRIKQDLKNAKKVKEDHNKTDFPCPDCKKKGNDAHLVKRFSKFGPFLSCSNYPECKFSANIGEDGKPVVKEKKKIVYTDKKCPKCKGKMVLRESKYGKFMGCAAYPKCTGMRDEAGEEIKKSKKKYKKKDA